MHVRRISNSIHNWQAKVGTYNQVFLASKPQFTSILGYLFFTLIVFDDNSFSRFVLNHTLSK